MTKGFTFNTDKGEFSIEQDLQHRKHSGVVLHN